MQSSYETNRVNSSDTSKSRFDHGIFMSRRQSHITFLQEHMKNSR